MKKSLRIVSLILAIILSVSLLVSCGTDETSKDLSDESKAESSVITESSEEKSEESSAEEINYRRNGRDFDTLSFEEPDFEAIRSQISYLQTTVTEGKETVENVVNLVKNLKSSLDLMTSEADYLDILVYLDATNTENAQKSFEISEKCEAVDGEYSKLMALVFENEKYGEAVKAMFPENKIEELMKQSTYMDDEYASLVARIDELMNKYDSEDMYYTVPDGRTLSVGDIYEEYGSDAYAIAYNDAASEIYLEIIEINNKIAKKAGYDNYIDYAFAEIYHYDFTPEDVKALGEFVRKYIIPVLSDSDQSYLDFDTDKDVSDLDSALSAYCLSVSADMYEAYSFLKKFNLYINGSDEKMSDVSFTEFLDGFDMPVIFAKDDPGYYRITNFLHEFGHFYYFYLFGNNMDFSPAVLEIHSLGNELLFTKQYNELFGKESYDKITYDYIYNMLFNIAQSAMFCEFEMIAYTSDFTTADELNQAFNELCEEYQIYYGEMYWCIVRHFLYSPMYFVSYGVASVPVLELFFNGADDYKIALEEYDALVKTAGVTDGITDLATKVGYMNPFEEETIKTISEKAAEILVITE